MKYLFICICLCNLATRSQTPYPTIYIDGTSNWTNGTHNISNVDYFEVSNSNTQNAIVDLKASKEILMLPNATMANLTNTGNFHAAIDLTTTMELVSFNANGWYNIPRYDKFEIGVKLPSNIQSQINDFLNGQPGINPYDPNQIQIECTYNNGAYKRYGFYYRDFITQNNQWIEQPTDYTFRVRIAAEQLISNIAVVKLIVNGSTIETITRYFGTKPNGNPGHLNVASNGNLLKLQFDNGNMFFGIGQNISYANDEIQSNCAAGACTSPASYETQRSYLKDLADNGGQFTRIRLDAWSYPIEWQYKKILTTDPPDSYSSNPVILNRYLGNYDVNQRTMWELDKTFDVLEDRGIYAILCLLEDQNFTIDSDYDGGHVYTWEKNPYAGLLGNDLAGCKNFFSNQTAKNYYRNQLYYIMARWGYSKSLAMWEMINETINVANTSTNKHLIESDVSFNTDVKNWVCDMKFYLQQFYPLRPVTTGFVSADNAKNIAYNCLNVWSSNSYVSHLNSSHDYIDEDFESRANTLLGNSSANIAGYFYNLKPFFWGEMGMGDKISLIDRKSDRSFHNAIWASSFTGGISNGLYWYDWEQKDGLNHRNNFKALRLFMDNIDFTQRLEPFKSKDVGAATNPILNHREIHTWWLRNGAKNYVVGWTKNNSANWTQDLQYFPTADQQTIASELNFGPSDADEYTCFSTNQNPQTVITGLLGSTKYKIKIYDTYNNANELETQTETTSASGKLTFRRTMYSYNNDPFNADYAFMIKPNSNWRLANNNEIIVSDTVYATTLDTVQLVSNFASNPNMYKFNWDAVSDEYKNNGSISVNYPYEGTYTLKLEAKSLGSDTIINHNFIIMVSDKVIEKEIDKLSIYPNPANNFVYLYYNSEIIKNPKITCIDMLGREQPLLQTDLFKFNISSLPDGIYIIKFKYSTNEKTFKINIAH